MSYRLQGDGETIRWTFDFTDALASGDGLTGSPTATATEGASAANVTRQGNLVSVDVSGVPFGKVVRVVCTAATTNGETLQDEAALRGGLA